MIDGSREATQSSGGTGRDKPVVEVVMFAPRDVCPDDFEVVMRDAILHLRSAAGYAGHTFGRCVEDGSLFVLVIWWRSLEAHTVEFRRSPEHAQWQSLLSKHIYPDPWVRHFEVADKGPQ